MKLNDREAWIAAKALHIAKNQLRSHAHPPAGDIIAMDTLLKKHFAGFEEHLNFEDMLQRAVRLGMPLQLGDTYTFEMLEEWLNANADNNGNVSVFARPVSRPE